MKGGNEACRYPGKRVSTQVTASAKSPSGSLRRGPRGEGGVAKAVCEFTGVGKAKARLPSTFPLLPSFLSPSTCASLSVLLFYPLSLFFW